MLRNVFLGFAMLASMVLADVPAYAAVPSLHQVYQAADTGRLDEAQTMMHDVLSAHPNSSKAHYVEAEILAKQGQFPKAEAELATAERLEPGLPFAKPQAVQNLRGLLGSSHTARPSEVQRTQSVQKPVNASSLPWGILLIGGLGLIAFILFAARLMSQRNAVPVSDGGNSPGYGFGNNASSYGSTTQPYGAGGIAPVGSGPGIGSRVMGGLATGAAVGVGMVAGEALMHRFMDGNQDTRRPLQQELGSLAQDTNFDDMGGNDFGVSDTSSWDDSSSSDSGDWN